MTIRSGFGQFHDESEVGYWTGLLGEYLLLRATSVLFLLPP